jgi:hypothetical protein
MRRGSESPACIALVIGNGIRLQESVAQALEPVADHVSADDVTSAASQRHLTVNAIVLDAPTGG